MDSDARSANQRLRQWAHRKTAQKDSGHLLEELRRGRLPQAVSDGLGVPRAWVDGVAGFYDLLHGSQGERVCTGTACAFAGGSQRGLEGEGVRCLGRCYAAPTRTSVHPPRAPMRSLTQDPVVLRHLLRVVPH